MNWNKRSREVEEMDDLELSGEVLEQTLKDLSKVHRMLGGHQQAMGWMNDLWKIDSDIRQIVDFGCGGGDSLFSMHKWGRKKGIELELTGMDANASIIQYARQQAHNRRIDFKTGDIFNVEDIKACCPADVAVFSLFLHHFSDEDILSILKTCLDVGIRYVIISDLQRSKWAYRLFQIATKVVPFSPMARADGLLSIKKGFNRDELYGLLKNSPYSAVHSLNWKWAFRHVAIAELDNR